MELAKEKQNVRKDLRNIVLLMFLYMLQTIPMGLTGSLPYIFSSKKTSYADQGLFSIAFWPFSLKLLWAPVVDSLYFKKFGRRKSWLVPLEYLIGIYLISFSGHVRNIFDDNRSDAGESNIQLLTGIFFMFTFLAATHDICVDGWALTMLSKENLSWGSTCESVGGTAGWFIGNVLFLVIESAEFSNKYIRKHVGLDDQPHGIVPIDKFMFFFGVVYVVTATFVLFFKREISKNEEKEEATSENNESLSLFETYKIAWKIVCLKPIHKLIFCMFTLRIGMATESMAYMKIVEAGVPKEKLGLLAVPLTPLNLLLPFAISRMLDGNSPFKYFRLTISFKLLSILVMALWVYVTPLFKDEETGEFQNSYYLISLIIQGLNSIIMYATFIPVMIFFAQISDKNFGGTYLTFLNTIYNLSRNWVSTGALYLANFLSVKVCDDLNEKCETTFDPFYMLTILLTVFGFIWVLFISKILLEVEKLPKKEWEIYRDKIKLRVE